MDKTRLAWRMLGAMVCCAALSSGCSSGVPSAEDVLVYSEVAPFLVGAKDIRGVYGNNDVDSIIFTYASSAADPDAFWKAIEETATNKGWHELQSHGGTRQFERIGWEAAFSDKPSDLKGPFRSAELVRVAYLPERHTAVVGYVQGDTHGLGEAFAETREAEWADRVIWPRFERLLQ